MTSGIARLWRNAHGPLLTGAAFLLSMSLDAQEGASDWKQLKEDYWEKQRSEWYREMIKTYDEGDYRSAKSWAKRIVESPGGEDYGQCQAIIDTPLTEPKWGWGDRDRPNPETWSEWKFEERTDYLLELQKERLPKGYDQWASEQKVEFLVESMPMISLPNISQDIFFHELVSIGDAAVPSLIEVLANDNRLTRSTDHVIEETSISTTRACAVAALTQILRIDIMRAGEPNLHLFDFEDSTAQDLSDHFREFWAKYGDLPFDERMMTVLQDRSARPGLRHQAAWNLGILGQEQHLGAEPADQGILLPPDEPNPAIEKFNNPTAAEAMLTALDEELNSNRGQGSSTIQPDRDQQYVASIYLTALTNMNDLRILPEVRHRFESTLSWEMRHEYARVAAHLNDLGPTDELSRELDKNRPKPLPATPGGTEIDDRIRREVAALRLLADRNRPALDRILRAATHPHHPLRADLVALVAADPKKEYYRFASSAESIFESQAGIELLWSILDNPADPSKHSSAPRRAAELLDRMVFGFPDIGPNESRRNESLQVAKAWFARHRDQIVDFPDEARKTATSELRFFNDFERPFMPKVEVILTPATKSDAESGKALFHLDGKGRPASMQLPAVGRRNARKGEYFGPAIYIFQAEQDESGSIHLGCIDDSNGHLRLTMEDVEELAPVRLSGGG